MQTTHMVHPIRGAALAAIHEERERQDSLHGFDPTRATGFGRWWARLLDKGLHWLYERALRRNTLTWAHTLVEEVGEVLASRTPAEAVKELREVAAVCVKIEEALTVSGDVPLPENKRAWLLAIPPPAPFVCVSLKRALTPEELEQMRTAKVGLVVEEAESPLPVGVAALEQLQAYVTSMPESSRTPADCQALLGAAHLAIALGVSPDDVARILDPAALGAQIATRSARRGEGVH